MSANSKGVVVEFDFVATDGAKLLFDTLSSFLDNLDGLTIDARKEAMYFAGRDYLAAFQAYLDLNKSKKTAPKAAKDFADAFTAALTEAVPQAISPAFRALVGSLKERGLKVIISSRIPTETLTAALGDLLDETCVLYREVSTIYGSPRWDSWRRACAENHVSNMSCIALTGSGFGVRSSLKAGMGVVAVLNPRVAYQDFSGADGIAERLDDGTDRLIFRALRMEK